MRRCGLGLLMLSGLLLAPACGGDSEKDAAGSGGSATGGAAGMAGSDGGGSSGTGGGTSGTGGGTSSGRCGDAPPAGAALAKDPPAYAGTCPTLAAGANTIKSSGNDRTFVLALPKDLKPTESLPVIFLWHWTGGSGQDFYQRGEVQAAVDAQRFIGVLPDEKGDLLFKWPVEIYHSQARYDEELQFFDDLLACVSQKLTINKNCVSSAGVSAGALWTAQLAGTRSEHLSSFLSLSGGVGGVIKPFGDPPHKAPGIVLWGGPTDSCAGVFSFESQSKNLENALVSGGHFFLECVHNCGHAEPPFTGSSSKYKALWDFALDHPYWLPAGESPYQAGGIPVDFPAWCGIGKDSATPRTGTCDDPSQC